jgi:hypothetical protein
VNVLHRLLKNTVTAETGIRAYAMYSLSAVDALGLGALAEMSPRTDVYDDVGEVKAWIEDLEPVWEQARAEVLAEFADDDVVIESETTIHLPVDVMWSLLLNIEYRKT